MARLAALLAVLVCLPMAQLAQAEADNTPFVDTQKAAGKVFRGAMRPFGMLMWGPNEAGYSLTYLSGASMPSQFDNQVPILPLSGDAVKLGRFARGHGHIARPKSRESGEPGYFRAEQESGETIELATTTRAGIARIAYAGGSSRGSVLFYLHDEQSSVGLVSPTELQGETTRGNVRFHFFARFSRPISGHSFSKDRTTLAVTFDTSHDRTLLMKLGVSFTRAENARLNLVSELPGWDFEAVRKASHIQWQQKLAAIELEGGTAEERRTFYTNFYHMFLGPSVFSDVNGEYLGFDGEVHHERGHTQYANFSGWDIYRSWVQLMAWLYPRELSDMMQTLVNNAVEAKGGMPRWPVANRETGVMDPGSATPIVSNAYAFGARDFDVMTAYEILDRQESDPSLHCQSGYLVHEGLDDYLRLGYVPMSYENGWRRQAASITLEYALGDFALSRLAGRLGFADRAAHYEALSQNWRNLFHPGWKLIVPRGRSGGWIWPFVPWIGARLGFTEGDSYQYTWMVPHNLRALIDLMGGDEAAVQRLDVFFRKLNTDEWGRHAYMGNEPSFDIPFVYNWAHAPWKTQEIVRRTVREVFLAKLPGDDDLGETSSWSVWAMLGVYPAIPGLEGLAVASPLFPRATLHLGDGRALEIVAPAARAEAPYVHAARLNGQPLTGTWLPLSALSGLQDNRLEFELGTAPDRSWGAGRGQEPPSFGYK